MSIRYGVTIEFTVDDIIAGGPSKATIRKTLRQLVEGLAVLPGADLAWGSLENVAIKYLHEATQHSKSDRFNAVIAEGFNALAKVIKPAKKKRAKTKARPDQPPHNPNDHYGQRD